MRALQLTGPRRIEVVETASPEAHDLADGQALLDVTAVGICGSDLPYFRGTPTSLADQFLVDGTPPPGFPAHEVVGIVRATRDAAVSVGEQVVGWASHYTGLAERVIVRADDITGYDPAWIPEHAILVQPLACVLYAVEQLGDVRGRRAAVLGLGAIGALFSHVLVHASAEVVGVDPLDRRASAALTGAHEVVVATAEEWAAGLDEADRADIVVEAVGHQPGTLAAAVHAVAVGGVIYAFGVPDVREQLFPFAELMACGATLRTGLTLDRVRVLRGAVAYLQRHPELEVLSTATFGFSCAQEAFDAAIAPRADQFKLVVVPD